MEFISTWRTAPGADTRADSGAICGRVACPSKPGLYQRGKPSANRRIRKRRRLLGLDESAVRRILRYGSCADYKLKWVARFAKACAAGGVRLCGGRGGRGRIFRTLTLRMRSRFRGRRGVRWLWRAGGRFRGCGGRVERRAKGGAWLRRVRRIGNKWRYSIRRARGPGRSDGRRPGDIGGWRRGCARAWRDALRRWARSRRTCVAREWSRQSCGLAGLAWRG